MLALTLRIQDYLSICCAVSQVVSALEQGGAKKTSYLSGVNTHCIVGTDPDYNEVSEVGDPVPINRYRFFLF